MSIKTLRKRIALVAVSAMGFGILTSIAPANATGSLSVTVRGNSTVFRAAQDSVQLTVSASGLDSSVNVYGEWLESADSGNTALSDLGAVRTTGTGGNDDVDTHAEALDESSSAEAKNNEDLSGWLTTTAYSSASSSMLVHIDETENDTAGDYVLRFWADTDNGGDYDAGEPTVNFSWTSGGAAADATCSFTVNPLETTDDSATVLVCSFVDADEYPTREGSSGDYESTQAGTNIVASDTGGTNLTDTDLGETRGNGLLYGGSGIYTDIIYTDSAAAAGDYAFQIEDSSTVIIDDADEVLELTLVSITDAVTSIEVVAGQTGVYSAAASTTATAGTATASLSASTIYYKVTGTAATYVKVVIAQGTVPAVDLVTSTSYKLIGADGTITFGVTNPTPADGEKYTVTAYEDGTGDPVITTTYADDTPTVSVISPATAFTVKVGSTSTIVVRATDPYNSGLASAAMTATIAGRNAGLASALTTDASGYASFTVVDKSTATVTDKPTDTVTFTVTDADGDTDTETVTITYTTTGPVVGSVVVSVTDGNGTGTLTDGTDDDAANDRRITVDTVEDLGLAASTSYATIKAQVKSSTGAPLGAGVVVSWSAGADDLFGSTALVSAMSKTSTSVTNSAGEATIYLYRQKTGSTTVTATAAGVSGNSLEITALTDQVNARYITVSADPAKAVVEGIIKVTGTVTDRWGNAVPGVSVVFSENGAGRLYGTQTATGTTNALGQASFDMTSLANEAGTNTVTITVSETGTQVANPAGFVTTKLKTGATAGVSKASTSIEFTTAATGVSNAEVLAAIVKLIASINKQIANLQKLIRKK